MKAMTDSMGPRRKASFKLYQELGGELGEYDFFFSAEQAELESLYWQLSLFQQYQLSCPYVVLLKAKSKDCTSLTLRGGAPMEVRFSEGGYHFKALLFRTSSARDRAYYDLCVELDSWLDGRVEFLTPLP